MVFNSPAFLFMFLPLTFFLYHVIPGKTGKNILLGLLSLIFYAFGGVAQLPVLVLAAVWNYLLGLLLAREGGHRALWRALAVAGDLALLGVYKYLDFLLSVFRLPALAQSLPLPLGISFFTFHAISYIVDVYRDPGCAEKRFDRFFLYIAFFPRLLAGPIVRWREGRDQLTDRETSLTDTAAGLRRFVRGMAKKLLLAESAAAVANSVYALEVGSLSTALAWLGALAYCLQIYFDFAGYSDMAIGLGTLFGFTFPENFDYPYTAKTLTEFWRRWHMTLNRWFVDYLYIPLGGSRRGIWIGLRNRMIVFFFTGLWHGAGWTFILWGLWHGLFVSLEGLARPRLDAWEKKPAGRALLHIYTLLVVLMGFVMFRAAGVGQAFAVLGRMFSFVPGTVSAALAMKTILTPARAVFMGLGVLFSLPVAPMLRTRLTAKAGDGAALEAVENLLTLAGLFLCVLAMAGGNFTPFIYQQF